jgi:hypothetical protein
MIEIATLKLALPKQKRDVIPAQARDPTGFGRGEFLPGILPFVLHTVVNLQIIRAEHIIKLYYTIPIDGAISLTIICLELIICSELIIIGRTIHDEFVMKP